MNPKDLDDRSARELLQLIADLTYWGPRFPEAGQAPDVPGFDHANASYRLGAVIGVLLRYGIKPAAHVPGESKVRA